MCATHQFFFGWVLRLPDVGTQVTGWRRTPPGRTAAASVRRGVVVGRLLVPLITSSIRVTRAGGVAIEGIERLR